MLNLKNYRVCGILTWSIYYFITLFPALHSPGKNTEVGCHFLLQGIFPTQALNLGLMHGRWMIYHLSHQGQSVTNSIITLFPALHSDLENQSHNRVTVKDGRLGVTGGIGRSGLEPHRKFYLESIVTVWLFSQPGEKPNSGCCYLIGLRTPAGE